MNWINQIERWFAELPRKQCGEASVTTELEADIAAFIDAQNESPGPCT